MKKTKRIMMAVSAFALAFILLAGPAAVLAQSGGGTGGSGGGTAGSGGGTAGSGGGTSGGGRFPNPIAAEDLSGLLDDLLGVVIMLGSIVVVFFYILAGFKYVTARGDSKQISSATQTLTWTTVGAFIILGAQVIASAIEGTVSDLGVTN